ncbi:MAG: hypothetical protein HFH87_17690 [Lachnospiraceae bacterium]|nr:hypothetical protein [Lachnospiraceae bacterium]
MNDREVLEERYGLVMDRIREIPGETLNDGRLKDYFDFCARFLLLIDDTAAFLEGDGLRKADLEELERRNQALYADILPDHYEKSYGNPAWAVRELGEERGRPLCALYAELRSLIGFVYEGRQEEIVIRMELFVEVYASFVCAQDCGEEPPSGKEIRDIFYWFAWDYAEPASMRRLREQLCPEECAVLPLIMESDLTDLRYLYGFGEYVGEAEMDTAAFLAGLPEETIRAVADTCTERYRMEFEAAGRDLSKKKTVALYYRLGFERILRRVIDNFAEMGLRSTVFRSAGSVLDGRRAEKVGSGFCGGIPNRQYDYDHGEDRAVFFDKKYANRKLEALRAAYEENREAAAGFAGPAMVESFGETDFQPIIKKEAFQLSGEQKRLWMKYRAGAGQLRREYISEEKISLIMLPGREELLHKSE